jgi:hypothetical protein
MPASPLPAKSAMMCSPASTANDLVLTPVVPRFVPQPVFVLFLARASSRIVASGRYEDQPPCPSITGRVCPVRSGVVASCPTAQSLTAAQLKPAGGEPR